MGVSGTVSTDGLEGFYSRGGEVRYFAWRAADMVCPLCKLVDKG